MRWLTNGVVDFRFYRRMMDCNIELFADVWCVLRPLDRYSDKIAQLDLRFIVKRILTVVNSS